MVRRNKILPRNNSRPIDVAEIFSADGRADDVPKKRLPEGKCCGFARRGDTVAALEVAAWEGARRGQGLL